MIFARGETKILKLRSLRLSEISYDAEEIMNEEKTKNIDP